MIKNSLKGFIIIGLLMSSSLSYGESSQKQKGKDMITIKIDPEAEKSAYKLFETLRIREGIKNSLHIALNNQFKRNPAMRPYRDIYEKFFDKYTKWEDMKKDLAKAYASKFTIDEMNKLTKFYSSEVGKKSLSILPSLSAFAIKLAKVRIASHAKELRAQVAKKAKELANEKFKLALTIPGLIGGLL